MTKITNTSQATQGLNTKSGTRFVRPGETVDNLEFHDAELEGLKSNPHVEVDGAQRARTQTLGDLNASAGMEQPSADQTQREEYIAQLEDDLATARSETGSLRDANAQLESDLKAAQARVVELENARDGVQAGMVARHKGGGQYSVFQDQTEVLGKMTKDQSDEFNKLPDDRAKTQWVKEHTVEEQKSE
jgi:hypothetical protein